MNVADLFVLAVDGHSQRRVKRFKMNAKPVGHLRGKVFQDQIIFKRKGFFQYPSPRARALANAAGGIRRSCYCYRLLCRVVYPVMSNAGSGCNLPLLKQNAKLRAVFEPTVNELSSKNFLTSVKRVTYVKIK